MSSSKIADLANAEPPWPAATSTWATYPLHCHCGRIRYKMTISPPLYASDLEPGEQAAQTQYPVIICTCSWCARNGIRAVHPLASNLVFTQGLEFRGEYRCGSGKSPHWFCVKCASVLGTDARATTEESGMEGRVGVNVCMLKDYDETKLVFKKVEVMKDMPPRYSID